jgi:hypothetical protein
VFLDRRVGATRLSEQEQTMKLGIVALAVLLMGGAAIADTLTLGAVGPGADVANPRWPVGNPYDGTTTYGNAAQDFETPYDAYDVWVVSDFTMPLDFLCGPVIAQGFQNHDPGVDGTGANFRIYNGLPWAGGSIVMSASGGYDHMYSAGMMGADFHHQLLPAGSYYMVFQVVRTFETSGQAYVYQTTLGNNNDYQWNPGGGFGFIWTPIMDSTGVNPIDVNWQFDIPEPSSLLLIGVALLLRRR